MVEFVNGDYGKERSQERRRRVFQSVKMQIRSFQPLAMACIADQSQVLHLWNQVIQCIIIVICYWDSVMATGLPDSDWICTI